MYEKKGFSNLLGRDIDLLFFDMSETECVFQSRHGDKDPSISQGHATRSGKARAGASQFAQISR